MTPTALRYVMGTRANLPRRTHTNDYTADPSIYRRFNINGDRPNPKVDTCPKCHGWGGIFKEQASGDKKPGGGRKVRWARVNCDQCPRGTKREYPPIADTELVRTSIVRLPIVVPTRLTSLASQPETGKECDCCGSEKVDWQFPVLITLTCTHESTTCFECVQGWIRSQLDNGVCSIGCPGADCDEKMEVEDIQRHAPEEMYQRYLDLTLKQNLAVDATFKYCLKRGCTSGQYVPHDADKFECDACSSKFCLKHDPMVNHTGESCQAHTARIQRLKRKREEEERNEEASQAAVKKIAMACPKCNVPIEKSEGCDHMTCTRCKFQFCYLCGAKYGPIRRWGNHKHKPHCKYHSTNLSPEYDFELVRRLQEEEG